MSVIAWLRNVFLLCLTAQVATAFQPTTLPAAAARNAVMGPLHVANPQMESELRSLRSSSDTLYNFELPKTAQPFRREDAQKAEEALLNVEVNIGRFAMVAALAFFMTEVATGKSLPEQVFTFATQYL